VRKIIKDNQKVLSVFKLINFQKFKEDLIAIEDDKYDQACLLKEESKMQEPEHCKANQANQV